MTISRRAALARIGMFSFATLASISEAHAITSYRYDALGRLRVVVFDNGSVVHYIYDAAGNRTNVVRSPSGTFSATIPITGTSPVNLRTLATAAGYDGAQDATIAFTLGSSVTITGTAGTGTPAAGTAIDSGDWPDPAFTSLSLSLTIDGKVYGGGGHGAQARGQFTTEILAGPGGDAINCRTAMSITVSSTGQVKSGGGGGGGGYGWYNNSSEIYVNGGGGGGGFPNGVGGGGANTGSNGTTSGGGAGGAAGPASGTHVGGAGGAGGGAGATGANGVVGSGSTGGGWQARLATPGAVGGYAIRKNLNTVAVTNNGTITGAVG